MAISKQAKSILEDKADTSGVPYSILKEVFERGQAAWLTGSRPGIGMMQWALARVNSFIRGSRKHDLDLRDKMRKQ